MHPVSSSSGEIYLSPAASQIDTNCTGCNAKNAQGNAVLQLAAKDATGDMLPVVWSVTAGDAKAGAGTIDADGRYTPPPFLTADHAQVVVTARLASDPHNLASTVVTISPGFLAPLTPANVALGQGGTVKLTGKLAQAGGNATIHFALADASMGTLSTPVCEFGQQTFTTCTVSYTAPASFAGSAATKIVASVGGSRVEAMVLLNESGVMSNPATHQASLAAEIPLGSSGGNNADFDAQGNTIVDCCSGTLGALVQDNAGKQYILSNNHVLARSDHAALGDPIVQPGLIDNNCTPNGEGAGTVPVAWLSQWLQLSSANTNADAAIAQVGSRTVNANGKILELGSRSANGELTAAAPGVSSSGGKGETATLGMHVAKSGRTTGLTCAGVSAIDLDVSVDYFKDCAETQPYLTKTFTHQVAISGDHFSDAGDSGSLVVDTANAEPVGLLFAGGVDNAGVSHAVANPASDVLNELAEEAGGPVAFSFVGETDHPVSCLQYGESTVRMAQARPLSDAQIALGRRALSTARDWAAQIPQVLAVALGKSSDMPGEAVVLVYVQEGAEVSVPQSIRGVRTAVVSTTGQAVALGTAPLANAAASIALSKTALAHALPVKEQVSASLMRKTPGFFGVGVGYSLDNPREAALVIFVDRNRMPASMPPAIDGVRTRYILMDRLHVTRSYLAPATPHCAPHSVAPDAVLNLHRSELF